MAMEPNLPLPPSTAAAAGPPPPSGSGASIPPPYQDKANAVAATPSDFMADSESSSPKIRNPAAFRETVAAPSLLHPAAMNSTTSTAAASTPSNHVESLTRPAVHKGAAGASSSSVTASKPISGAPSASNAAANNNNNNLPPTMDNNAAVLSASSFSTKAALKPPATSMTEANSTGMVSYVETSAATKTTNINSMHPTALPHPISTAAPHPSTAASPSSFSETGMIHPKPPLPSLNDHVEPARNEHAFKTNTHNTMPGQLGGVAATTDELVEKKMEMMTDAKTEQPTTSITTSQVELDSSVNIATKVISQEDKWDDDISKHSAVPKEDVPMMDVMEEERKMMSSKNATTPGLHSTLPMKDMTDAPTATNMDTTKEDAPVTTLPHGGSSGVSPMDVEASEVTTTTIHTAAPIFPKQSPIIPIQERDATPSSNTAAGSNTHVETSSGARPSQPLLGGSFPVVDNGNGGAKKKDALPSPLEIAGREEVTAPHNMMMMQPPPPPSAAAPASLSSVMAPTSLAASSASSNNVLSEHTSIEHQLTPSMATTYAVVSVQGTNIYNTSMTDAPSSGTKLGVAPVSTPLPSAAVALAPPALSLTTNANSNIHAPAHNTTTSNASSSAVSNMNNTQNSVMHPTGRELKVEDALLYLDQVKLEFGDRPRIYNEFLEIMKNFKAQEVDTIGVINRVRSLFHGYNNLILGFNTFLPEGYKIEMRDLEPVFVGPGLTGTSHTPGYKPPPGPGGAGGRGMPPGRGGGGPPRQQHPGGRGMGHSAPAFGRGNIGGRGIPPPPGRGMMGRGPPPAGPSGRGMPGGGRGGPPPPQMGGPGRGMLPPGGRGGAPMTGGRGGFDRMPVQQKAQLIAHTYDVMQKQPEIRLQPTQQQEQQTRTIEFDHAILYVTNIKKRFANQPRIYHTFLEILHTYQKEQRGIKEVLEQVSSLFADHPDLLREFTFFLPDAVQEQAKERLSRAAAEAEAKQRAAAVEAAAKHHQQTQVHHASVENGKLKSAPTGWRTTGNVGGGAIPKVGKMGQNNAGMEPVLPSGTQKFIDMTQPEGAGFESTRRPSASGVVAKKTTPQEVFIYNAGVERQFFDLVKAALTSFSRDGQAYAEFIKTLDMYAQEILSRNDMLGYVERLLGKHKDLFEEFKRIINAVGSPDAPTHDDSWHSVPLSEIDFSRCRRCSPSYRALPRDYPNPPCSERSEAEAKVLNDVWVSLPMGSEENSTFRHMRKNQYEETLFQCEDMRFEIDMCIDSNAATLHRLIKISDELLFLSENELLLTKGSSVKKSLVPDGAGFGGKIYQYTLDGRVLGVIHKLAIKRIYGDDGNEMLELCFKNPAVALPIVVNRLRQKDEEWRAARDMLNKKWKDLAELNYYMSLDHRSITWRATDKRATSTRSLVAEIKDRAAHNGVEGEVVSSARIEKAKEEHGAFYEVTMGCAVPRKVDLTGLPLPTRTLFTPHMSFGYDNTSWAQHDAYRIVSYALERGSVNPGDKERCHRLWCDFIGPWFGLSLSWMHSPAAFFTDSFEPLEVDEDAESTSTDDEDKENGNGDEVVSCNVSEVDANNDISTANGEVAKKEMTIPNTLPAMNNGYFSKSNHVPFPPETFVSTTFGEGKIIQYIEQDGVYEVSIPPESIDASTAYLRIDAIYGTLFPVEPSLLTEQLRENDQEKLERADDQLIIGTQCLYLFFRLHQILIRRLTVAKKLARAVSNDLALGKHIEKLTVEGDINEGEKRYGAFLDLVYSLIDAGSGSADVSDGGKYEDRVMHLLGNNAYELTTMDKLISHVLKHLQNMANDDVLQNMIEIYRRHRLAGTFKPSAFREEASLMSDGENMFAFQICDMTKTDQKICYCEFLGCISEDVEDDDNVAPDITDNKRGINDNETDDADVFAQDTKRLRRDAYHAS